MKPEISFIICVLCLIVNVGLYCAGSDWFEKAMARRRSRKHFKRLGIKECGLVSKESIIACRAAVAQNPNGII